jgi:hypothetical protein
MKDYQLGKIYKLVSPIGLIYIGASCEPTLARRKTKHKADYHRYVAQKRGYVTSFKLYEEDENNVEIILVEKYPCNDKDELHKRERYWIEQTNCVNKVIPSRTSNEYYQDNKVKILEHCKNHYQINRDKITEQNRKKYSENKDKWNMLRKMKYTCSCGGNYTHQNKLAHLKTSKHLNFKPNENEDNS